MRWASCTVRDHSSLSFNFLILKCRTTKERRKAYRQTGNVPEFVHFYSLATLKLVQRPIDGVYGVKDLYKDASDTDNVFKIEQDLSKLENHAARVIENIHSALPSDTFRVKRRDLNKPPKIHVHHAFPPALLVYRIFF
jgi:hypothetical protein